MKEEKNYHMDVEAFRKHGKQVIDWLADYYESIEDYPVLSQVAPGEIRNSLPAHPPVKGESFDDMLKDVSDIITKGITHWQSPNFYAYFPANVSGPSILGELLSAGFGVQGMLWSTSPACTELETHVMDWLAEALQLPEKFYSRSTGGGVIEDSASSAALCALLAARERVTNNRSADFHEKMSKCTIYISSQTHSSLKKACIIAGISDNNIRYIPVDENYSMNPDELLSRICQDRHDGFIPMFVCASVGTTSSLAIDPVLQVGEICSAEQIWLHIDAAMAGTAAVCPEYRYLIDGVELADSFSFNPHKWMFTNFDCNCFYVADKNELVKALTINPEYLKNKYSDANEVIDYRDWQVSLGRRFRSLKLWFVIRYYGLEGIRYHIKKHIGITKQLTAMIQKNADFEILSPVSLNLICFRHNKGNDFNKKLLDELNKSGKIFMSHTVLDGKYYIRLCVGQTNTELSHVEKAWKLIEETADQLKG
ncbi:MAG: aspartate aminotransferase family protein [Lentisphaerae bacterium]|nr:aspartate aminotransferase family protein [Lentisphaerota bacterium]MCP4101380.1 aspartate aminotransferase family protein [Lentisphaerota bacterium]